MGYSPPAHKESYMTEQLMLSLFIYIFIAINHSITDINPDESTNCRLD